MDAFIFRPVIEEMWTHSELKTDVFDIDDLLDAHEILDVKQENNARAHEWAQNHPNG